MYQTEDPFLYHIEYKDDTTVFNRKKRDMIFGKAAVKNQMTGIIFSMLEEKGVPTHFIKFLSEKEQLVKAVEILPIEVIVRNVIAGAMAKRLGIEEGTEINHIIFELCYKNDDFGDPFINDDHAIAMGLATATQIQTIRKNTMKINEFLKAFFLERGIKLVDFKIEFGLYKGEVILADEMSLDKCRLWDLSTNKKIDKDRFLRDIGHHSYLNNYLTFSPVLFFHFHQMPSKTINIGLVIASPSV